MFLLIFIIAFVSLIIIRIFLSPFLNLKFIDHHILETLWTIFPMILLLFMALPSLFILYLIDDITNPNLIIKVVGHQWYWEYEFSSLLKTPFNSYINNSFWYCLSVDNRLPLPLFANIQLLITSSDVIHSWTTPRIGVKVDAVPGRLNSVQFTPSVVGIYFGQCSEICGANHRFIPIRLHVLPVKIFINLINNIG